MLLVDPLEVTGIGVDPPTSGTTPNSLLRVISDTGQRTDHGATPSPSSSGYVQSTTESDQSAQRPYLVNPNGGMVGVYKIVAPLSMVQIGGSFGAPIRTIGGANYTAVDDDYTLIVANAGTARTITLIQASLVRNRIIVIVRDAGSTGAITVGAGGGGATIQALNGTFAATTTLAALGAYGSRVTFQADSANRWVRLT